MRNKIELFKRYGFFFFGILTNAVGVSLITRSNLGVGPTTCIPYIISRIPSVQDFVIPLTYGTLNFLFNFILLLVQLLIQRKNFNKLQWLQLPVALLFSVFLDVAMKLTANINLDLYVYALLWTLLGCVLRAFGVSCQVLADVVMLPTEAFIKSVSDASKKEFSVCKLLMDVAMTAIGCGISFLFMHKLIGIREGTLISVLIVGPISHYFTKKMGFTTHYFENEGDDGAYVKSVRLDLTLIDEDGQQMWQDYGIRHSLDLYVPAYEVVDYTFFIQEPGIPGYYGTFDYRWRADINWEEIAG